jgi:multiple sugar transport system ATP-binding protein
VSHIVLDSVRKVFPNGVAAVNDVSLGIEAGEFIVLVGPSGCGKSTLLRMIAGLEEVTDGDIYIADRNVTHLMPKERDVAMVFQNYALYPHMTVADNVGFGLRVRKQPAPERKRRVSQVARILHLQGLLERRPAQLSGGQRQRVAMGRAIVREPRAFLMDEPLSNLDAKLRVAMRAELMQLHQRLARTTIYVTHDQVEAMTLGDRVAVMHDGVLQQCDTPQNLFHAPTNLFVATFIGSPAMNVVEAEVADGVVKFGSFQVPLPNGHPAFGEAGRHVILGIRPSDFEDDAFAPPGLPRIDVRCRVVEDLGSEAYILFGVDAPALVSEEIAVVDAEHGESGGDEEALFTARVDPRTHAGADAQARLAVSPERFYFFDAETKAALATPGPPRNGALAPA